jgi:hypothetical protein
MNYSRTRWFCVAVSVTALCFIGCAKHANVVSPAVPTAETSFITAIAGIKHSIAPVVCVQTRPTGDWDLLSIEGTAFFVSADGSFITPNHVLDGLVLPNRGIPCQHSAIYLPEDGVWHIDTPIFRVHYALFFSQTCRRDSTLDVAFCTPVPNAMKLPSGATLSVSPVEFETHLPVDGTSVAFSGFPLSNTDPISAVGFVAGYQTNADLGTFTVIVDRGTWPGASGSPIYLPNGHVIGMVLARGTGDGTGLTYGRLGRFVQQLLPAPDNKPEPHK